MVEVGRHGAFAVNRIGLNAGPFPLSFSVRDDCGSWRVAATAARAVDVADVLARAANDTIAVVDLATNSFVDEEYVQWRPSRIAAEQGVNCEVHSLGALASGVVGLSEEVLVMRRDDLPRFLAGWSPYELTLVDLPESPPPERLDEIALIIGTAHWDGPVLPGLDRSQLFYSGHDDCYFLAESADRMVPEALLSRLLALLVGSALLGTSPVEVPDPPGETVASLIVDGAHWIGVLGAVSENMVTVNLSATAEQWRLGQRLPERVDRTAVYHLREGSWRFSTQPDAFLYRLGT